MTCADEQTSAHDRTSAVDSGGWARVVDAVLPAVWELALERSLSAADAAVVCDATLLALLDSDEQRDYATEDGSSMASLAAAVRRRAAVECDRMTRLISNRSTVTSNTIDLTDTRQREGVQL